MVPIFTFWPPVLPWLGKICGIDEGYEDFPLLYFPVPRSGSFDKGLCVSECPPVDPQFPDGQQIDSNYELDCKEPVDNSEYDNCAWSSTNIATIAQRLRDDTDSQLFGANFGYPTSSCKWKIRYKSSQSTKLNFKMLELGSFLLDKGMKFDGFVFFWEQFLQIGWFFDIKIFLG